MSEDRGSRIIRRTEEQQEIDAIYDELWDNDVSTDRLDKMILAIENLGFPVQMEIINEDGRKLCVFNIIVRNGDQVSGSSSRPDRALESVLREFRKHLIRDKGYI